MAGYLIVDGYNIINSWEDLKALGDKNMEAAREKLIDYLMDFAILWDKITVVFDAHQVPGGIETRETFHSLEVIYTREKETADNVIEKITHNFQGRDNINILVATSDRVQQEIIFGRGARRISARELKILLESIKMDIREKYTENIFLLNRNSLDSHLQEDVKDKLNKWRRAGR
ncbi:MAG: NYN domain-containing protein, partial [Candidatus Syntrophonatronum acetioxidans]